MTIEKHTKQLIDEKYCRITKDQLCEDLFIRYYNPEKDTIPFCIVKEVFPNRIKVRAYKGKRNWFVSFDKVNLFFTKQDPDKRFYNPKKK
jgi:hypothetical protein